jgi:phosphoglycerate dehydrogenase-like enzyme
MTEHLFALLFAITRHIPDMVRAQDRGEWGHGWRPRQFSELYGKTMAILGWGKIGDSIAHGARAFGMRVIGTRWSVVVAREVSQSAVGPYSDPPWLELPDTAPDIVYPSSQLHDVLAQSDVIVSLLPLTDETRGLLGQAAFRSVKRGAILVSLGRGAVVSEPSLVEALRSGRLRAAALDVLEEEPLPRNSPLWSLPNVIISPHLGGMSEQTRERAARLFAVNLGRYVSGQPLLNEVKRNQGY